MDRNQHITQDAAEFYAVYKMAEAAIGFGISTSKDLSAHWENFKKYLDDRSWDFEEDFSRHYPLYRKNVDHQIPQFVGRLKAFFPGSRFDFELDEAVFRSLGLKADFMVIQEGRDRPFFVSLKNYIGKGGVQRPQLSSGTFLSFAAGFIFDRSGVGKYLDPRVPGGEFSGRKKTERDAVLAHINKQALVAPLQELEDLQQIVRSTLLPIQMYDPEAVKEVVRRIVPPAQRALLEIFDELGHDQVRKKFLERAGLDSDEDLLFFDQKNSLDSITNPAFSDLKARVNDPETLFTISPVGQSLRFAFSDRAGIILSSDVPLTVNTNGAWFTPKLKYEGLQEKNDKGKILMLRWGQIRPAKSREISTSTNLYLDLKKTGVLGQIKKA